MVALLVILGGSFLAAQDSLPITKEAIQQRITELETGRNQAIANVHAFGAAIQECTYWLQRLEDAEKATKDKEEKKDKKDKKEKSKQAEDNKEDSK
jgi:hypothetical protein